MAACFHASLTMFNWETCYQIPGKISGIMICQYLSGNEDLPHRNAIHVVSLLSAAVAARWRSNPAKT
jgi:hypothetical protein